MLYISINLLALNGEEIQHNELITISELAKKISLSQSTVTNILERLEKRQFITRKRDAVDKRKVLLNLSAAGVAIAKNSPSPMRKEFIINFCALPQDY